MKGRDIFAIFLIVIILVLAAVFLYLGLQSRNTFNVCQKEESPYCFTITCRNKTKTCGNFAYRCVGNNQVRCDNAPLQNVDIDPADIGLCSKTSTEFLEVSVDIETTI